MKYIKIFENFESPLYQLIGYNEYTSFSDRRNIMDINPDVNKILKMIKSVFGEAEDINIGGYIYKKYEVYDKSLAYFQIPYKDKTMIPPGFNIVKYDDDWHLVTYFPPRIDDFDAADPPTSTNYKIDTIRGVKDLLIHLKSILD